jgi:hypothetical protein
MSECYVRVQVATDVALPEASSTVDHSGTNVKWRQLP